MTRPLDKRRGPCAPQPAPSAQSGPGSPEPFLLEILARLPRAGLALDVAAGRGRHSLVLARTGITVVAIDSSVCALGTLVRAAREQDLRVCALAADLSDFPLPADAFDVIVNINFLDRDLVPRLKQALKPGGFLLFDTFLVEQAEIGKPRNPAYLLRHRELRELLSGLELLEYREGLAGPHDGRRAWRACALALKRN